MIPENSETYLGLDLSTQKVNCIKHPGSISYFLVHLLFDISFPYLYGDIDTNMENKNTHLWVFAFFVKTIFNPPTVSNYVLVFLDKQFA